MKGQSNVIETIMATVAGIAGVVLGWLLSEISKNRDEKPRLSFLLVQTPDEELTDKELRTKTSPSEYSLEIYNMGKNPVILTDIITLSFKNNRVDVILCDQERKIKPYENVVHILDEQDADAMVYHCSDKEVACGVITQTVDGKTIKAKLDLSAIVFLKSIRIQDGIIQ